MLEHPERWLSDNRNLGRAHHSWVAVGVGVAGAAVSVGASYLTKPKKSGPSLPKYKSQPTVKYNPGQKMVEYNPVQGSADLLAMYPNLASFAQQATDYRTTEREKIMPGAKNQFSLASGVLQQWLQGKAPQDSVDFTNRAVAERTGGGFNPFTGGGQSQQAFARSIGQLSSDFMSKGVSAAPTWQSLANSFIIDPTQVAPLALAAAEQRYKYDALNANLNLSYDQLNSGIIQNNNENIYRAGASSAMMSQNQENIDQANQNAQIGTAVNAATGLASAVSGYRSTTNLDTGNGAVTANPSWTPTKHGGTYNPNAQVRRATRA